MIIQSQKKKEKNVHKNQGYHSNKIRVVKFDSSFFFDLGNICLQLPGSNQRCS